LPGSNGLRQVVMGRQCHARYCALAGRTDPAHVALKLFEFPDLIQTLANFKYFYKFDLKSEKYEINFLV
jgi:hypothetical protein